MKTVSPVKKSARVVTCKREGEKMLIKAVESIDDTDKKKQGGERGRRVRGGKESEG